MLNREFAMQLRTPKRKLSIEEVDIIENEIKRIKADRDVFIIDTEGRFNTIYKESIDKVIVGANVFPDLNNPSGIADKMSVACVLAHEYYGHRAMRDIYLNEEVNSTGTNEDEFNASFLAYKNTPNLTDEERQMLFDHAYEIARNGMLDKQIEICKKIIKEQFQDNENADDDKENIENKPKPYTR